MKTSKSLVKLNDTFFPVATHGDLDSYLAFVNSIPMLTQIEEFDLAEAWRTKEDVEAARYLVLTHLRLVVSISRGYIGYGLPLADIIQEGTIGLMKAVKRFDARKNVRLETFAMHWIKAEIHEFIIKNLRIIKTVTTKTQRKLFFKLRSMKEDNTNAVSLEEATKIAKELNLPTQDVMDMDTKLRSVDISTHLDNENDEHSSEWLQDSTYSPSNLIENELEDILHTTGIEQALSILDDRSKDIVVSRWLNEEGNQLTLHDLSVKYNISKERVRQIEASAFKKMKEHFAIIKKTNK